MGARGNSGVISSQLFRGFAKSVEGKKNLSAQDLADAFVHGVETAYKAVMKPVEGTILTVAREAAKAGLKAANGSDDALVVMTAVVKGAKRALAKTPDLLAVLKEVGVVDSGGQGLVFIYEGFREGLSGEISSDVHDVTDEEMTEMINAVHHQSAQTQLDPADIVYGYCTEMMVELGHGDQFKHFDYEPFRNYLNTLGDSTLVVADEEVVKVHVHTEHPGTVFRYGQQFGDLLKIKVDNMRLQQESIIEREGALDAKADTQPLAEMGVVAIAAGQGLGELFKSLGVTYVLNGGQTMNPSTNDILDAVKSAHAKHVIVLPNNGNIFMAAEAAAKAATDVEVAVVKSKTINQGMTAMLGYNPDADLATNQSEMTAQLPNVVSGSITQAIRDTTINGLAIKNHDWMGIIDGTISVTDQNREVAAIAMVNKMINADSEIVTIIVGADASQSEAKAIAAAVGDQHPDLEFEIHQGDQPVYPYFVSVE